MVSATPRPLWTGVENLAPTGTFFCILFYSALHPRFFLCLVCPAFCIFVFTCSTQHKHPCPRRDSKPQPQQAIGRRSSTLNHSERQKPVPVLLYLPQIPHGLTWHLTRTLRGERPKANRLGHCASRFRSPDRPARRDSLHRLSYRGAHYSILYLSNSVCWLVFQQRGRKPGMSRISC